MPAQIRSRLVGTIRHGGVVPIGGSRPRPWKACSKETFSTADGYATLIRREFEAMFTAKSDAPNAPHIKCSVVMPGQIGTSIRANKRKIHSGDRELDATDGASLAHARERFALVGRDVSQLSDDQLCNLVSELERRFRDEGLTSAPMFTTTNGRLVMISTPPESSGA